MDGMRMAERDPAINKIKEHIDLVDLILHSSKLTGAEDEYRGAHENKHPSESGNCLVVNRSEGTWYCHHCKVGGDCFSWIADRDALDVGEDFPQILEIAAEYAGIEIDTSGERQRVFECLTAAAEHFNSNMTNEMYADIEAHWGITREIVDKLQIGMSKIDHSLEEHLVKQGFSFDEMQKSGLFSGTVSLYPFFRGRYVFSYWVHGQVRYMIARASSKTPDNKYEKDKKGNIIKFKKLPTQKKKKYISKYVKNDVMFGLDSLGEIGGDFCIITEGVSDAIMAIQAGFPCVSPVTTRFRGQDQKPILRLVRKFERIYIVMDNEENEAGLAGAYSVCKHLIDNKIDASIVELPRPPEIKKIDLADYLRDNGAESFRNLLPMAYKPPEFFKPPPEQFLTVSESGTEKFSPLLFAEWLVKESNYFFKSFFDNHEILFYVGGVYKINGRTMIGKIAEDIVGDWITNHSVTEVIGHVERLTYIERDEFDADPYVINLKNCLYDLRTGTVMPHTPDHLSLNQLPVMYDENARCERFDQFLREILPDDRDRRTTMEMFGHTLISSYDYHYWFILLGGGANGKTTLLNILNMLLGLRNVSAVALQDLESVFSTAQMFGKMANISSDLSSKDLWQTGVLKKLTGKDPIMAQFKNKPLFEFYNHATMIFATNELPAVKDRSVAFKRRVVLIQFNVTVPLDARIKRLDQKLSSEECLPAILNFAIHGARNLIENDDLYHRYGEDEMMRIYVEMSDSVATFVFECIEFTYDDEDVITKKELYIAYKNWWKNKKKNGMTAALKGSNSFSRILGNNPEINEGRHDTGGGKTWKWIKVKNGLFNSVLENDNQTHFSDTPDGSDDTSDSLWKYKNGTLDSSKNSDKIDRETPSEVSEVSEPNTHPEVLLESMKTAIFKLGYTQGLKEFNVTQLLIKGMPKIEGLTTELLTQMLDEHLDELKIVRLDDGIYKQKGE
jgi:P4 family phage/plasmid primase-like protien